MLSPEPPSVPAATAPHPPPSVGALSRRARRFQAFDWLLVALLLATNIYLACAVAAAASLYALSISLILLALSYCIHLGWTIALFLRSKSLVVALRPDQQVGRYQAGEIQALLHELLAPRRDKELPQIYVTDERRQGAYVVNSLFFDSIKPLNAVYMSRDLFSTLRPDEIKAILAHELAHFYGFIRPLNRVRLALMIFNALLPLHLALSSQNFSFGSALGLWLAFSALFNRILAVWLDRASRDFEYLCDLEAARRYGILNFINGLVGTVRTIQIQERLLKALLVRIQADPTLSIARLGELLAICDKHLPDDPRPAMDVEAALDAALASEEANALRKPLKARQRAKEKKAMLRMFQDLKLDREYQLLDWKRFDNVTPDGRLDAEEYHRLIQLLRDEPHAQLFDSATDNAEASRNSSHPTAAQRILFLEQARQSDPRILL